MSSRDGFPSKELGRVVSREGAAEGADHSLRPAVDSSDLKRKTRIPSDAVMKVPPLPDVALYPVGGHPYLARVEKVVREWISNEWQDMEAIRRKAMGHRWTAKLRAELEDARLTSENLAARLDNVSLAKLRRELLKLDGPRPGQLIREARLRYGCHLLINTRLMVREIAERAGYGNEKHFAERFRMAYGLAPTDFRRHDIATHDRRHPHTGDDTT